RGVNNTFHFSSPSIIWRNIINFHLPQSHPQIKGRNFEVPACGGFLLTEPAEDLYNFYEYEKEIVIFNSLPELIKKTVYYLNHEEERKRIAQAGYERTLMEHTWGKRFSEFFDIIQTGGKYKI
ncbi:MAG: glycosyltransferase, partial [Patescibacteria group bacterium]